MLLRYLTPIVSMFLMAGVISSPVFAMGTAPQSGAGLGTGQIVATAGIRGLDEERLRAARFDAAELDRMESYTVSAGAARSFAAQGGLNSRSVAYLPDSSGRSTQP